MKRIERGEHDGKRQDILPQTIIMLSDAGNNVVVDNILLTCFQTLKQYVSALHDHPVLLVKVDRPSHELRRREAERGNRNIGQGKMQLEDLEPQTLYDVTVGTCANTTAAFVSLIRQKLAAPDGVPAIR